MRVEKRRRQQVGHIIQFARYMVVNTPPMSEKCGTSPKRNSNNIEN